MRQQGNSEGNRSRNGNQPPPCPVMLTLDIDNDRELSGDEIDNAAALLAGIDADKDGTLTHDDFRQVHELHRKSQSGNRNGNAKNNGRNDRSSNRQSGRSSNEGGSRQGPPGMQQNNSSSSNRPYHPPSPLIIALDTDKNREITVDEIENASEAFYTLDKNGDGKISSDELKPKRGSHGTQNRNR